MDSHFSKAWLNGCAFSGDQPLYMRFETCRRSKRRFKMLIYFIILSYHLPCMYVCRKWRFLGWSWLVAARTLRNLRSRVPHKTANSDHYCYPINGTGLLLLFLPLYLHRRCCLEALSEAPVLLLAATNMTPDAADTVVEQGTFVVPDFSVKDLLSVIPCVSWLCARADWLILHV